MSRLMVHELKTTLSQQITVGIRPIQLYAIRPHLVKYGTPTGSLAIRILTASGAVVDQSEVLAISNVLSGFGTYPHGYQRFLIQTQLKENTIYQVQLVPSGGYSFSESGYIAWANEYYIERNTASYTPNQGGAAPFDMEIWEMREARREAA